MNGNELSLQVRGKLRQFNMVRGENAANFVTVGFTFGSALQVEEPAVPGRDLYAFVTERRSPA